MEIIFCGKRNARAVLVLYKYCPYFRDFVGYVLIWYSCGDGVSVTAGKDLI